MKHTYEIQQNQFNQYYYTIKKDNEVVDRSKLYVWEEECAWEACRMCDEYNKNEELPTQLFG